MPYFLVRFERSHSDDDEYVEARGGLTPENYLMQTAVELFEGGFQMAEEPRLAFFDSVASRDAYYIYVWLHSPYDADLETFATRVQCAYDEGAVAGWFQVITKGSPA